MQTPQPYARVQRFSQLAPLARLRTHLAAHVCRLCLSFLFTVCCSQHVALWVAQHAPAQQHALRVLPTITTTQESASHARTQLRTVVLATGWLPARRIQQRMARLAQAQHNTVVSSYCCCVACGADCSVCASPSTCGTCSSGFYVNSGSCTGCFECLFVEPVACFVRSHLFECVACSGNCETCSSASVCTKCDADYYLFGGACVGIFHFCCLLTFLCVRFCVVFFVIVVHLLCLFAACHHNSMNCTAAGTFLTACAAGSTSDVSSCAGVLSVSCGCCCAESCG